MKYRRWSRISANDFLNDRRKRKSLGRSGGHASPGNVSDYNFLNFPSWVSESFRQDIGQLHSPRVGEALWIGGTAGKRTSSIAAQISVEHKMRGSYKDDRTSDRVDVFSVERGREKTYKGFEYFSQGHDQESCGKHFFLLWLIFCTLLHIGQLTITHFNILEQFLNTRWIEVEYSRRG